MLTKNLRDRDTSLGNRSRSRNFC